MTWVALASLLLSIEIRAAGDCPGAADVERQLVPLLGDGQAAHVSDVATIERRADGAVSVSLADVSGQPIGDRRFPRARTCGEQAKTVAVTLAIWEAQLHPEIALRLDRLAPEVPPAPGPLPPPNAVIARQASPLVDDAPARGEISLGVAVLGDVQTGAWAPGARLELGVGRAGARWRARFSVVGVGRHTIDVAPGQATWWRAFAQLGADVDVARGQRWAAVAGAGGVAGVVSITGEGFAQNRSSASVDLGAEGRVRLEWRPGRVRPWLGAAAVGWLRRQSLDLQGGSSNAALPRVEPMVTVGADFVW